MTNGSKTSVGGEPSTSEEVGGVVKKQSSSSRIRARRRDCSSSSERSSGDEGAGKSKERRKDRGPFKGISRMIRSQARIIVSQNRRRIKTDGFDLDLTYITDRIIAMGYPANATEALYRNSMKHIIRFLEKRHKDHYKVFNLTLYQTHHIFRRGQYSYDPANFKNRVISFEMTDHHPPRLELMAPFCREVHEWLLEDARNVVAVHCKAGKGRTGVMICAYLSYCLFYPSPRQNMDYYSVVRTRNNKGVTIPSQRRYVYYYDHLRKHQLNYLPLRVQLVGIYVERLPTKNGALLKEKLCLSVANGDVDVFFGEPIAISDEIWNEEEAAWAGHVVSNGADSHDPNDPEPGKDVISRRAYGWTIPVTKPVFLEGDVRVNLYVNKKFINLFSLEQRNKLGHIWFNTMFSCPGACGDVPYIHGDEAHPYPEGETTIAERKNKFHIGEDENVPCSSTYVATNEVVEEEMRTMPVMKKTSHAGSVRSEGKPAPQSLASGSQQSKSQPLLSPDRSPASSFGGTSSPTGESAAKIRRDATRKSMSKLSKAGKAAKRFFSTSEGAKSRASEPTIHSKSATSTPRRSNPEMMYASTVTNRPPINFDELQIAQPPGLERHCADESLKLIYHDKGRQPPRIAINRMLAEAHEKDIVQDVYNERRRSVPSEGEPVKCGADGRPFASGPNRIVRNADEHVAVYPVMEIDRAFKNGSINNGFKLFIVTKCVEPKTYRHSEAFMKVTYEKQKKINDEVFTKSQSKKTYVDLEPKLAEYGAGKTWPPVIQYGNVGMQGNGGEAGSLCDDVFRDDARSRDDRLCRYFYKQRRDSVSRYPSSSHTCPATGFCMDGSMRSERLNTGTTIASEKGRSITPVDATLVDMEENSIGGMVDGEEMDDLAVDMEVRSYHPNSAGQWDQSASSRSSSSSDDLQNQQTSYVMSTDYSGVESSMNEMNITSDSQKP